MPARTKRSRRSLCKLSSTKAIFGGSNEVCICIRLHIVYGHGTIFYSCSGAVLCVKCNGACCGQTIMFGNGHQIDLEVPTFFPEVDRVIAIGDVHGDVDALVGCLKVSCIDDMYRIAVMS